MKVIKRLNMDLSTQGHVPLIYATQEDACRWVELSLYDGSTPWEVSDGASVAIAYKKPDGKKGLYDTLPDESSAVTIEGNKVLFALSPQSLTTAGLVLATVVFWDSNMFMLSSFELRILVHESNVVGAVLSENYVNLRQSLVKDAEDLVLRWIADGTISGPPGPPGYTPVRGVDYWNDDDKAAIQIYISSSLAKRGQLKPEFANSTEDCTDTTKLYVLPDGYIYAYMEAGGYTNLVPESTDADGSVYEGKGYLDGYCLAHATSGATLTELAGHTVTGFIPFAHTDVIRMAGVTWEATNKNAIMFFDVNKKPLGGYIGNGFVTGGKAEYTSEGIDIQCLTDKADQSVTIEDGVATFTLKFIDKDSTNTSGGSSGRAGTHVKYVRISAVGSGEGMIVTLNEEIVGNSEAGYAWRNTGFAFVPADYESRIIDLEEASSDTAAAIETLKQDVEDIVAGNTAIAAISKFDPAEYNIPVLYLTGDDSGMSKDNAVPLNWKYGENSGTCTLKWQGSSSLAYPKKNFTIKLGSKIEVVDGWGEQSKYCLKANYIDHTHARNVVSAKLWGKIVASRKPSNPTLASCPNYGAVDGFPVAIMLNGEFQGLYTWNIPKDKWTFNMVAAEDSGAQEAIICANYNTPAVNLRSHAKVDGTDHELEEVTNEDDSGWVATSLNQLIDMLVNSYGADLDTTIAQYLDWESAIDYCILTVIIDGRDMVHKNYIMVTWDGTKWVWSAYDLDATYGLHWDGSKLLPPHDVANGVTFESFRCNRVMELIYRFKTNALKARYKQLREGALSEYSINEAFESFGCSIPSRLLAEDAKRWPTIPSTSVSTTDQILRWLHFRLALVDKWVEDLPDQETPIEPSSRAGNTVPTSTDSTGAVYNGMGYKNGYTLDTSTGVDVEVTQEGCCITGFIPVNKNSTIKVTTDSWNISPTNSRIIFYNAKFQPMAYYTQHGFVGLHNGYTNSTAIQAKDKQSVSYGTDGMVTLNIAYGASCKDLAYIRVRAVGNGKNIAVTVNN